MPLKAACRHVFCEASVRTRTESVYGRSTTLSISRVVPTRTATANTVADVIAATVLSVIASTAAT